MTVDRRLLPDPTDLDGLRRRLDGGTATAAADGATTTTAAARGAARRKPIGMQAIRIGPHALDHLVADVAAVRRDGPVVVVMDHTPMRRDGTDLKATVLATLEAAFPTRPAVVGRAGEELHADEAALAEADDLVAGAGCVVSVGSGTITDIAKDASMRAGDIPFVVVQTAVSVNAFSDDMAVLLRDGVKRTVPSRWPDVLIADLGVLADTPAPMNRAGFGELCSMFTAPADWYLASAVGVDDRYDPAVVALYRDGADGLLDNANRIADGDADPALLEELAARMTLTGIAMGVAGLTAPLSGTEHLFSHLLDMAAGAAGRPLAFHGAQVGVAGLFGATVWEDTLASFDPTRLLDAAAFPSPADVQARVRAAFDPLDPSGAMGDECWRDVERKLAKWHAARPRVEAFVTDWERHRAAIRDLIAPPDRLRAALDRAGAATTAARLDPPAPPDVVRWAAHALPLMRDRFTVADLRFFAGDWTETTVDAWLRRSGIAESGR
jgi:glycerol-1-phosphate dehydrogenase [NAD(P)+]